jgi:hypothetical protein
MRGGVEYFYGIGAPDIHVPNPAPLAPVLFGRPFDGPMEQHELGQPPHYDLHVWVWQAIPPVCSHHSTRMSNASKGTLGERPQG